MIIKRFNIEYLFVYGVKISNKFEVPTYRFLTARKQNLLVCELIRLHIRQYFYSSGFYSHFKAPKLGWSTHLYAYRGGNFMHVIFYIMNILRRIVKKNFSFLLVLIEAVNSRAPREQSHNTYTYYNIILLLCV